MRMLPSPDSSFAASGAVIAQHGLLTSDAAFYAFRVP